MNELVTIVMATYNGEKYLDHQLTSILAQSYSNLELVVVDDCSGDRTMSILQKFSAMDNRVRLVQQPTNSGVVATFERGLALARGNFIALADQDDFFDLRKIENQVRCLSENPDLDLVVSDLRLVDECGKEIAESMWQYQRLKVRDGHPFKKLLYANFATGCAIMVTRRLLEAALPFPPNCYMHDWWLAVVASRASAGGIALLKQPLTNYRQHGRNVLGAHSGSVRAGLRRAPDLKSRTEWYRRNTERIEGYRTKEIWTAADIAAIETTAEVFNGFVRDPASSLVQRIMRLPVRLRFAFGENFVHLCGITLLTICPMFVDKVLRIKRSV